MTVFEMINAVNMGVDKTSTFETVSFEEAEILLKLNEAQDLIVKQKVFGNNYRKEGYDTLHGGTVTKRSDDLSNLIRYSEKLTFSEGNSFPDFRPHRYHPNIAVVNLTFDETTGTVPHYLYYVGADFKATKVKSVDGGEAPMETIIIEQKNIGDFVETPTNKPFLRNGFVYLKEGEVNVIHDPFIYPYWLYISYVMQPKKMVNSTPVAGAWETEYNTASDWENENTSKGLIPEQVHPEIVELAVNLLLENVADPRYQTHSIELAKKE